MKNIYYLFDEVRTLYNTSEEAWKIYNELKQRSLIQQNDGIHLYVCSSERFAGICFDNLCESLYERFNHIELSYFGDIKDTKFTCDEERKTIKIVVGEEVDIYKIVTLKEIKNGLDGWRVKDVKFYE